MPPPGSPRPAPEVYDAAASWLEAELDRTAQQNPGRPALRRLNRAEYGNAIRDLLDLQVDVESLLLPDDAAFGFDNIGDLLDVSPALLERYLTAADIVSALAVGDGLALLAAHLHRQRIKLLFEQIRHLEKEVPASRPGQPRPRRKSRLRRFIGLGNIVGGALRKQPHNVIGVGRVPHFESARRRQNSPLM
jgi:hypothetical protein